MGHYNVAFTTESKIDTSDPTRLKHSLARYATLLDGLTMADYREYPVYVNVGNTGVLYSQMVLEISERRGIVIPDPPTGGIMAARFAAINAAGDSGVDAICRVEDGKLREFMDDRNYMEFIYAVEALREDDVDYVTFHRGEMLGYPDQQRQTEQAASRRIQEITGLAEYDSHSGPLFGTCKAMKRLTNYNGRFGNLWQSTCVLPPLMALVAGYRVGIKRLPNFRYPLVQFLAEDGDPTMVAKRETQAKIVLDIEAYVNMMKTEGKWPPPHDFILLD